MLKIALVAPSATFTHDELDQALLKASQESLIIVGGTQVRKALPLFINGTKSERLLELAAAENLNADTLWAVRGGCGAIDLWHDYDSLFYAHKKAPLIGYSDASILHFIRFYRAKRIGIHGPNFLEHAEELSTIKLLLEGRSGQISYPPLRKLNYFLPKVFKGELIIMNLISLQSLVGSFEPSFLRGKILALEETNEPMYKIYRALWQLKNSGALIGLKALLIGHMPECRERIIQEILVPLAEDLAIPLFDWPIFGHEKPNWPLLFGSHVVIRQVDEKLFTLSYTEESLDAQFI